MSSDDETKERIVRQVHEHIVKVQGKDDDDETAELKDALQQKDAQLQTIALKALEDTKDQLSEEYPQFKTEIEDLNSGQELDLFKSIIEKIKPAGQQTGRTPPTGKVGMQIGGTPEGETYPTRLASVKALYDELDEMAKQKNRGQQVDENRYQMLKQRQSRLWKSIVQGMQARRELTHIDVWRCWQCGHINNDRATCEKCGYSFRRGTDIPIEKYGAEIM